ncbi:MAG: hypothetical protein WDN01_09535 [Rhizomicrobium sp.]
MTPNRRDVMGGLAAMGSALAGPAGAAAKPWRVGDAGAQSMPARPYRAPWTHPA